MKRTGYWVFESGVVDDDPEFGMVGESEILDDAMTYRTKETYIPVTVESTADEPVVAYYYQEEVSPDVNLKRLREREGKVYVPMSEVHPSPPPDAVDYRTFQE